jgi:hypothetical protein
VREDEVLPAGLADDARVAAIAERFSPTVCHILWKTAVEPVKWIPASSSLASAGSPTSAAEPGTKLMTPGRSPPPRAARR